MSSVLALRFWRRENAHAACLALAFLIAAIYAAIALKLAYSEEYIVQDDARQHVFWMERFVDPEAFPDDLIADYFQSLAPFGYSALYKAVASLGLHPVDFSKILPAVLALVATFYVFRLTIILYPSLLAALITTIMFNQSLWLRAFARFPMAESGLRAGIPANHPRRVGQSARCSIQNFRGFAPGRGRGQLGGRGGRQPPTLR